MASRHAHHRFRHRTRTRRPPEVASRTVTTGRTFAISSIVERSTGKLDYEAPDWLLGRVTIHSEAEHAFVVDGARSDLLEGPQGPIGADVATRQAAPHRQGPGNALSTR